MTGTHYYIVDGWYPVGSFTFLSDAIEACARMERENPAGRYQLLSTTSKGWSDIEGAAACAESRLREVARG